MANDNMEIWKKVSTPPPGRLKKISGGRLSGMTDINPQWRLEVMTEVFGQIGVGWYYEIVKLWTESGANGEVMAFAHIHLFTREEKSPKDIPQWSSPIPGIGGSALVAKESSGLRANDEAYKMAVTDALSVAMKQLGVAADIYAGLWDGSKYKDKPEEKKGTTRPARPDEGKDLDEKSRLKVANAVGKVQALMEQGQEFEAYEAKQAADLDTEETLHFWTHFDSKQRSTLRSIHESLKKTYGAENLEA